LSAPHKWRPRSRRTQFRSGWAQLGDKPQRKLAKDLGISDVTLRHWLREEKTARGERPGGLSSDAREELNRLRDENAKLRMEREILRKAAVFFAREDDRR
jgi:transposase